jgi:hypothetical protein
MQAGRVVTSFESPQYRAFSEHDDVESNLPRRRMAALLCRSADPSWLQPDYARVASWTRISF